MSTESMFIDVPKPTDQSNRFSINGYFHAEAFREGRKIADITKHNFIPNVGFDLWALQLGSYSASGTPAFGSSNGFGDGAITFIAVGYSAPTYSAGSIALGSEYKRQSATYSHTLATQTFTETTTFGTGVFATGGTTLQESGVFTQYSQGVLFSCVTFGSITLYSSDTLQVTWTYNLAGS